MRVRSEGVESALGKWGGLEEGGRLPGAWSPLVICFVNGAGGGEEGGRTCLEFLHLGGLLLSKLSGCGKQKIKEAGLPTSRVTACKTERERKR